MVGVPGRSRGCNTCRKRKVKCSLETPLCSVCTNSKRVCLGYARERIFLQQDPSASKPRSYKKEYRHESKNEERSSSSTTPETMDGASSNTSQRPSPVTTITSPSTLSLTTTSTRTNMISTYLTSSHLNTVLASLSGPSAFLTIASLPTLPASLECALLALATCAEARRLDDPTLTHQSLSLYVRSLGALSADLRARDGRRALADETLAAAVLLVLYEVAECPDDSREGYMKHLDGCARLVVARGPGAHASGLGHMVFRMFRVVGTFEALRSHQTFLSQEAWITLPFANSSKTAYDQLMDKLLQAPVLLAAASALAAQPPLAALRAALALQHRVAKYDADLAAFYDYLWADAARQGAGPLHWDVVAKGPAEADPDFPVVYGFSSVMMGATLALLWAIRTIAWSGMGHLRRAVRELTEGIEAELLARAEEQDRQQEGHEAQQAAAAAAATRAALLAQVRRARKEGVEFRSQCGDFIDMARRVCRSVAFCAVDDASARTVTAPLNMVLDVLTDWPGNEIEKRWVQDKLEKIQNRGMRIMKHLRGKSDF